jgi:glutamate/tyrosine decarboxylase-like PLP-dependent enzyme
VDEPGRLSLGAEQMRALGHRTVDALVAVLADDAVPPLRRGRPEELRLPALAEEPRPYDEVLAHLLEDVLPYRSRGDHPGFFAFIPFSATWPGALGDLVASALNLYVGSWMEGAGATALELAVIRAFCDWIGYPAAAAGALVPGGSIANLTALACARDARRSAADPVGYVSDQSHSSIARAARVLGLAPHQLRVLAAGDDLRLAPRALARAIDEDVAVGRAPLFAAVSGGATNSGAVDPLRELAEVCRERGVWLHVDAAYGGFAVLSERGRRALDGIELAESVTLDPHKWLYQPYECGCVLVRDGVLLERTFAIEPHYLEDARAAEGEVNFSDRGLQLTRGARAVKVWLSLRTFGLGAFRAAVDRTLELAEYARRRARDDERLELLGGELGIVCLRRVRADADEDELERLNAALVAQVERSGFGLVSSTRLHGRYAIRLCILAHTTTQDDVDRVLDYLATAEPAAVEPGAPEGYDRATDVSRALLATAGGMSDVRAGDVVVAEGEVSTDFYVVVDGELDVYVDGERVNTMRAGDFFGELAALDWGAGYGYRRSASVVARTPATLRVLSADQLDALIASAPAVASAIRAALRERLARA